MHELSCIIYRRLVHVLCEIYNRIIPLEETEEEEIQLIKEINDVKKLGIRVPKHKRRFLNSAGAFVSGREKIINKCKNETFSILP